VSGCATSGLYSSTGFGLYTEHTEGLLATTHEGGSKTGKSCTTNILGIAATGNAAIGAAKKAGGIRKVVSVDREIYNVLGVYAKVCTVVQGE